MPRLALVLVLGVIIALSALIGNYHFIGLIVGLVAGAGFVLVGMARGGGLPEAGLSSTAERRKSDPNASIGTALAAAGIACAAIADTNFPITFRIFYGVCLAAGILIAAVAAWRHRTRVK
ncbi:MAG TPA: hypothetical protein VFW40_04840 [Capsulimonadaceae bacterium]|nr:hypothetical protein [Capsulimonadaceae bacterium]